MRSVSGTVPRQTLPALNYCDVPHALSEAPFGSSFRTPFRTTEPFSVLPPPSEPPRSEAFPHLRFRPFEFRAAPHLLPPPSELINPPRSARRMRCVRSDSTKIYISLRARWRAPAWARAPFCGPWIIPARSASVSAGSSLTSGGTATLRSTMCMPPIETPS